MPADPRGALAWLIIGGGIHGTYLSHVLVSGCGVARDRVRVVDPEPAPVARFWRHAGAVGMPHMRSTSVHHVDLDPYSLVRFAATPAGRAVARFVAPYHRPGLALFRAHTEDVVRRGRLDELRARARVTGIARAGDGFRVETTAGELTAARVVLALGPGDAPCWPAWARAGAAAGAPITHVFDPAFDRGAFGAGVRVVVVGGGVSGAQLAVALADAGAAVTIVARHAPRRADFDSDPAWIGPKAMTAFAAERDPARRRAMIAAARHRGSIPRDAQLRLAARLRRGQVRWVVGELVAADARAVTLDGGDTLDVDHVVLATGFDAHRPGGAWLDAAVDRLGLRCAACGYPVVTPALAWAPGLFVTGPLAELELGPTARNITGARAAGERIAAIARRAA